MTYFLIILVFLIITFLIYKYFQVRKAQAQSEGFQKRRVINILFLAFTTLIGITTLLEDAIFSILNQYLHITKPSHFDWIALAAFFIFALATVVIMWNRKPAEGSGSPSKQIHSGSGDNTGGDKVMGSQTKDQSQNNTANESTLNAGGNIHIGHVFNGTPPDSKKKVPKQLTDYLPRRKPDTVLGRGKDLDKIRELLNQEKDVVVNGMGGIGKTTLAERFVDEYFDQYQHLAWISLKESDLVSAMLKEGKLLASFGLSALGADPNTLFMELMRALTDLEDQPNLIILDNAEGELGDVAHYLPQQPNWHILLTSRQEMEGFTPYSLDFLSPEDAFKLFQQHCNTIQDKADILSLLKRIEYHTLTIEILAKSAAYHHYSLPDLENAISKDLPAGVKVPHTGNAKIDKVYTHLTRVFQFSQLTEDELWLLKQFVCLPAEFHAFSVLKEIIGNLLRRKENPILFWLKRLFSTSQKNEDNNISTVMRDLVKKGWLLHEKEGDLYKMHALIRDICPPPHPPEIAPLLAAVTEKLSLDQSKDNPVEKFVWVDFGESILRTFPEQDEEKFGDLQNNLGLRLADQGKFLQSKELLQKAVHSAEKNFGPEHPTTAIRYSNLALGLKDLGETQPAKELLQKVVRSDEKNFGPEHPSTANSYSNLATILHDLGELQPAKELLQKAIHSFEKNLGPEHPSTALRYSNLAVVLRDLGELQPAKKLLKKAISSYEKIFEPEHPAVIMGYSNLAVVLQDLGDLQHAKELLKKAVLADEKNFGPEHPSTAIRYSNLALVLKDLGENQPAKKLLQKALLSFEKNLGPEHPSTSSSYSNLAMLLRDLGEYQPAKELLQKALHSDEKNFGPEHPSTAIRYSNLATVLQYLGELQPAKELLQKAVRSDEKNFGPEHPSTARSYSNLALVLQDLGEYQPAKELLQKALRSNEKNFGPQHPTTAISYANLAMVLKDLGEFKEAIRYGEMALAAFQKSLPAGHPTIKIVENNLASIREAMKKDQK
ncbi:MAG: tetratricopeptide repeat protein [Bacteroidia bacterium]|nr:tetratricopeptide repeat protein [Bacteroidia bacterium]